MKKLHYHKKAKLLLIPGLAGFLLFYIIPLFASMYYAVIDNNFKRNFVGVDNFVNLFQNEYYILALTNTLTFTIIGVSLILLFSCVVSILFLYAGQSFSFLRIALILPMLLPTAGVALVWRNLFNQGGELTALQLTDPNFFQSLFAPQLLPLYLIFLWKYSGLNIVLITGAISGIEKEIYEAAALDGAHGIQLHMRITLPLIKPTFFFTLVLSIVNSFNIYREVYYLFDGDYPPDVVYLLQHFMNNHFGKLNYQMLSTGALVFAGILILIVSIFYKNDNNNDKNSVK